MSKTVKHAIILAGGKGTRLAEQTKSIPKPVYQVIFMERGPYWSLNKGPIELLPIDWWFINFKNVGGKLMTLNGYAINIENFIVYKNNYVDNIVILNELDRATLVHSRNVLKLSKMLGKAVGLNSAQMKDLHMGPYSMILGKLLSLKKY